MQMPFKELPSARAGGRNLDFALFCSFLYSIRQGIVLLILIHFFSFCFWLDAYNSQIL